MREIKFRIWDKRERRMSSECDLNREGDIRLLFNTVNGIEGGNARLLKQLVLIQYTGLHDKNDKEIYEGDIVALRGAPPFVVKWDDRGEWMLVNDIGFLPFAGTLTRRTSSEIIGNIYENGDLLKKCKKEHSR